MGKVCMSAMALFIALSLAGCSAGSGNTTQESTQATAESQGTSVTEEERQAAISYIGSTEYGNLSAYVLTALDGAIDLADQGNAEELQGRFWELSGMIEAMDGLEVPEICADVHHNLMQLARAEAVALADLSEAAAFKAAGDDDSAARSLEEANEHIKQATQFADDLDSATNDLTERFS